MLIPTEKVFRRTLMLCIAGTRGGVARLRILRMLEQKPRNINQLAGSLSMDYKTVQHHVRVLEKLGLVASSKKKYGNLYGFSALMLANRNVLKEIWEKVDKYGR
ncbi:MAG: winged helix-turn-helix transcriptional regulator [Candidatus Aenigmarchaeota archaeon]|nr:winged helix-turn-helix transcriptional regulator [Candidatus Aenigmarchaeota archaeon]